MKDDYNCNVSISTIEWDFKINQISTEICNFIDQNKERISKSFTHICEGNKFFLSLIKTFLYRKDLEEDKHPFNSNYKTQNLHLNN